MARFIDADEAIEKYAHYGIMHCYDAYDLEDILSECPTADVVEVVRCKDCKYAHITMDGECKHCDIWFPDETEYMPGDYYCASGERKDGRL